ncbi:MAG: lysyl oxidase family protein [Polyangiales bacterium]
MKTRPSIAALVASLALAACSPPATNSDVVRGDATMEGGLDAGNPRRPRPGCDPMTGIQCDGHYEGRCMPECAADQCCSPQNGVFTCVAADPDGYCPAPDISVRGDRIMGRTDVQWRYFPANDCALIERCVNAPGWRRVLLFDTVTPNRGTADLFMGAPAENAARFEYSACHMHYHFNGYAAYELRGSSGDVVATGHKQAFCLMDSTPYPDGPEDGLHYICENQGIQRGWQDVYGSYLDCQWVDVTDVAPGAYTLYVSVNTNHQLNERDYSNNETVVPVSVGPDDSDADPTQPCPSPREGANRQCGLTNAGSFDCTPGENVRVGCSSACRLGSCEGDTVLRICPGNTACGPRGALAINDDSGCAEDDYCSQVRFVCPMSGRYTVLHGGLASDDMYACTIAAERSGASGDGGASDASGDGGDAGASDASSGD